MTTEELMDLMYTPIYDEKMLKVMEEFEMEIPKLDEQYKMEGIVSTYNNKLGLSFFFEELNGLSIEGEPILSTIGVTEDSEFELPFGLLVDTSYDKCCKVLGKKADYFHKFVDDVYFWVIEDKINNRKQNLSLGFYGDIELLLENGFKISDFVEEEVESRGLIPNEE